MNEATSPNSPTLSFREIWITHREVLALLQRHIPDSFVSWSIRPPSDIIRESNFVNSPATPKLGLSTFQGVPAGKMKDRKLQVLIFLYRSAQLKKTGVMNLLFVERGTNGLFSVRKGDSDLKGNGMPKAGAINSIIFNRHGDQKATIDQVPYNFPANSILPLVGNQHFAFERPEQLVAWQFNRDFYCIVDHDVEVGCAGFLFYGIRHPLFVKLSQEEIDQIALIEKLSIEELDSKDSMQAEMLRILLKRLIIIVTRIAKKQTEGYNKLTEDKMSVVRMFNMLLEDNFKTQHDVQFYANALNKSPKTLANLFGIFNYPAPSKLIQRRIILEAKRYLFYTDKSAKEIAYLLGFSNPAHFSRFFKLYSGHSISDFRGQRVA